MKRRQFLKTSGSALAVSAAAVACTKSSSTTKSTSRTKFRWRLVMSIPKTLPVWGPGVERFAGQVSEMSRGDLEIKVYGAGELVPALGVFDAVKAGQVEMAHTASYYWQGKMPAAPFFTAVPSFSVELPSSGFSGGRSRSLPAASHQPRHCPGSAMKFCRVRRRSASPIGRAGGTPTTNP